jgi:hypothetical protein
VKAILWDSSCLLIICDQHGPRNRGVADHPIATSKEEATFSSVKKSGVVELIEHNARNPIRVAEVPEDFE